MTEKPRKHRLTKIRLHEISLVNIPAEPNSLITIFKRGESATMMEDGVTDQERMNDELSKAAEKITELTAVNTAQTAEITKLKADLAESQERVTAVTKAAAEGEDPDEALLKSASPALAAKLIELKKANEAAAAALAKIADETEIAKMAKVVTTEYSHLPIKAEDFAPVLKRAANSMQLADFGELSRVLKAADALAQEATMVRGFGRDVRPTSAEQEIQKAADALVAAHNLSPAEAYDRALTQNPRLYAKYQAERGAAN
jgi:hypothetical protein